MSYLLGEGIFAAKESRRRKELLSKNTYILALDGDIDFKPNALTLLVDLLKKNVNVAAACGRIHPVGNGEFL